MPTIARARRGKQARMRSEAGAAAAPLIMTLGMAAGGAVRGLPALLASPR
jgi:hypothetical protein